ncbi:hypothetical protein [Nocardioides dongxiaopingii]|uniref:hypothetical protein n=1 Tax=Nocardioides dongxiaopingii TaxID=2576036 RepID=UPI0010C76534|nr:hypothetical protein [Nocardioides dongxiaopingii]
MPRRPRTVLLAAVLTCPAVALGVLVPVAPAHADPPRPGAPVTQDDRVVVRGGGSVFVDAIGNDTDPDGDDLAVCRVDIPDGVPLTSGQNIFIGTAADDDDHDDHDDRDDRPVDLTSTSFRPGTYRLTYYACDRDFLTPGTITVVVERTRPVRARKVAPHVVRLSNPDDRRVTVLVFGGSPVEPRVAQRVVQLPPGAAKRVRSRGRILTWFAFARRGGNAGQGEVRGLGRD